MLYQLGEHGEHHVHGHEGLLLEAIRTDQDNVCREQHDDQVLRPDLRAVKQAPQNNFADDNAKNAQHQNRKDVAQDVVHLVDTFADTFYNFH